MINYLSSYPPSPVNLSLYLSTRIQHQQAIQETGYLRLQLTHTVI